MVVEVVATVVVEAAIVIAVEIKPKLKMIVQFEHTSLRLTGIINYFQQHYGAWIGNAKPEPLTSKFTGSSLCLVDADVVLIPDDRHILELRSCLAIRGVQVLVYWGFIGVIWE